MWILDLIALDYQVFKLINTVFDPAWLDPIMILVRNKYFWLPLYLFFISFFVVNFRKESIWIILGLLITVSASDLTSSKLVKPTVKRLRPCNNVELGFEPNMRIHCSSSYSFTSSHATNHFAIAVFLFFTLGKMIKKYKWLLIFWAFLISYAQVYVGAHFPIDVTAGAFLGSLIGGSVASLYLRIFNPSWSK
jgi:undecaprenyl-diphosphatase